MTDISSAETVTPGPLSDRQRQLVAAGSALRTWVVKQRSAWENQPRTVHPEILAARPSIEVALPSFGVARPSTEVARPSIELEPLMSPLPAGKPATRSSVDRDSWTADPPSPVLEESGPSFWANPALRWAAGALLAAGVAIGVAYPAISGRRASARPVEPVATKLGTAVLASIPPGSDVFIDGSPAGKTPVTEQLTAGIHHVEFRRRNSSRKLNIEIVAGQSSVEALDWTGKRNGSLEILTDPSGSPVTVDGVARGVTPLTIDDLAAGEHTVVVDTNREPITRVVTISPDAPSQIAESTRGGWLHVSAPIDLHVTEGSRTEPLDERNQVLLSSGQHDLTFENPAFGYRERRRLAIKTGTVTSVALVPPPSLLTVTATMPAEVFIDGTSVGNTPLRDYAMSIGNRAVVVKSITGAERRFTLVATVKPTSLEVDFSKR